jgi:putative ABC transport system substrate-binding protein
MYHLPALYPFRAYVEAGGLAAFAAENADLQRHAARTTDAILRGANPGDIPFYQPTRFELIINLKSARDIGREIPPALLAIADEVIEQGEQ